LSPELLPQRVAFFGLTALPPAYCGVLEGLGAHCDVHLFLLNPCREYWADIVDEGGRSRRRARALAAAQPDPGALLDLGNPLLAAFGHTGQAFLDQVLELSGESSEQFIDPGDATLLARLQQDILDLRDPRKSDPAQRAVLDPADRSLSVHCCHSPLREVQVLHDRLLAFFQTLTEAPLEPRDILVMAPDIDLYAPFVEAVFGAAPEGRQIPWSIADRRLSAEQPLLAVLSELLALPESRLTAPEVLSWLEVPAVARRFGIDDAGLARVRIWVEESGIRWGLDAPMREGLGLPADAANTWAFGLRRLFLGYALPADGVLYDEMAPYGDVEGADSVVLGALQQFVDVLGYWRGLAAYHQRLACGPICTG
jgi:exodeoxyribonuclease V gamma subunit